MLYLGSEINLELTRLYTKVHQTLKPVKINREPVSNCAYPTRHEENVKIFFSYLLEH